MTCTLCGGEMDEVFDCDCTRNSAGRVAPAVMSDEIGSYSEDAYD